MNQIEWLLWDARDSLAQALALAQQEMAATPHCVKRLEIANRICLSQLEVGRIADLIEPLVLAALATSPEIPAHVG